MMKFAAETYKTGEDLLKCLRKALGTAGEADDLSFSGERWAQVAEMAKKAGLSPFLFRSLPLTNRSLPIPADIQSTWLRHLVASETRNNDLFEHLEKILSALNQSGISAILLKGIHLMDTLYADRGMRTVGDIDILVRPENKPEAMRVMESLGYDLYNAPHWMNPIHCVYSHPVTQATVEVHFEIDTGTIKKFDMQDLWQHSQIIRAGKQPARALAPEELLVHLCLHLTHHLVNVILFGPGLRSLCDIALLLQQKGDSIDWPRLVRILKQIQGENHFALPIALARHILNISLPAPLAEHQSKTAPVSSAEIDLLKKHLLLSCERNIVDARMPKFVRSSVMAGESGMVSGFMKRIFVSPAELTRRYGADNRWHNLCSMYLQHFRFLAKQNFRPKKWSLGQDTPGLARHFKELASLRNQIMPWKLGADEEESGHDAER